jgi:putative endonuclease
MPYFVYIIQSEKDGSYYIGSTQDIVKRIFRHNQGRSAYTKTKRPWKLVYHEEHPNRAKAVRREKAIKRQKSAGTIEALIRTSR